MSHKITEQKGAVHQQQLLCLGYLVVVSAEIFKMPKADVREADDDCDDQNHKCEHGGRSCKACVGEKKKF